MAQGDIGAIGFDKARLVGVIHENHYPKLKPLQMPLYIDDSLVMVMQFEDHVSKKSFLIDKPETDYDDFAKKYHSLDREELEEACAIQDKDLFLSLPQLIGCVGCRRSVEHLFQQVQTLHNAVYESISVSASGIMTISQSFIENPKKLFHLFYCVRPKLYELLETLMNSKKNKRCIFHSLKMQKPNETPNENKPTLPRWCHCSIMDVWDRMCRECHEEVAMLQCDGIIRTMDQYLKKHRFCIDCKSKVQRAFHILTGEVECKTEMGFCSAIYEGLRSCNTPKMKTTEPESTKPSKHIHICCERSYIVHMLTQADTEMIGTRKERHAKTIDIAQEEVCTCLALHLYQRLHRVWHQKLTYEQTWLTLLYLGIEAIRQNFEMYIEEKIGIGRMEALCEELEQAEKDKELKLQKKRMRRKRQKKKKEQKHIGVEENLQTLTQNDELSNSEPKKLLVPPNIPSCDSKFHLCLLDMLNNQRECDCSTDAKSDEESSNELTKEEILEFERNRSQIDMQRIRLRERIRQDFENFCNTGSTNGSVQE
ncbi:unnamed protein product [Clavelina lepadiformis]|uniref:Gametogenetin-binding protein 2 n=1 Tax=Clavelina lepadiformis TaxID=159417 RepID=A0ABP0GEP0_CLALP